MKLLCCTDFMPQTVESHTVYLHISTNIKKYFPLSFHAAMRSYSNSVQAKCIPTEAKILKWESQLKPLTSGNKVWQSMATQTKLRWRLLNDQRFIPWGGSGKSAHACTNISCTRIWRLQRRTRICRLQQRTNHQQKQHWWQENQTIRNSIVTALMTKMTQMISIRMLKQK